MSLPMSILPGHFPTSVSGEPAWELATLFPSQGDWTVEEYLELTDSTNRLIEFTDGNIEVLPMPTTGHQLILAYLHSALLQFVTERKLGVVVFSALRVKFGGRIFREPDIVFAHNDHREYVQERFWTGADLVMEVVSPDPGSRERDYVKKRAVYAAGGVREYWIVDPAEKCITVLELENGAYKPAGQFKPGEQAFSRLLEDFAVDVAAVFAAANF
jgi:Uma2 family endonuclease